MAGKNDLGAKPDEPKRVSPEKPVTMQPQEGQIKKPSLIEPDEVKPVLARPAEKGKIKKPLVIEPDEAKPDQVKPAMHELKGEPGKKTAGARQRKKVVAQEQSCPVTLIVLLSLIFLAGGMAFLVLPILDISIPGWLEPVMDLCRKVPFPE